MEVLNIQFTPWLKEVDLGQISLTWSRHALERAVVKGITTYNTLNSPSVVEIERNARNVTRKVVVRLSSGGEWDNVLVLVPVSVGLFKVITCWQNHCEDNHATLKIAG